MTEKKPIGVLADFGADDLALAGGKGANLGELVRQGFPVPAGFVVTTDAYTALLADSGVGARLDQLLVTSNDADQAPGAQIRDLFSHAKIPAVLRSEIASAYAAMGGGPVAVRSSATAEDLPGAAFAGQQDTYLNVVGEDALLQAVLDCWASLWTDRAISYRQRQGIDQRQVAIAVVVQDMVQAETAGVLFSANPVTGERGEIVIDASPGLGEAVVSGLVTPEHYVLDNRERSGRTSLAATSSASVPWPAGAQRKVPVPARPVRCSQRGTWKSWPDWRFGPRTISAGPRIWNGLWRTGVCTCSNPGL